MGFFFNVLVLWLGGLWELKLGFGEDLVLYVAVLILLGGLVAAN